jgi:hypothetical protein
MGAQAVTTRGWAIKDRHGINVRTVQHSRIGAMVNWLLVAPRILAMQDTDDATVERLFALYAAQAGVTVIEVTIEERA